MMHILWICTVILLFLVIQERGSKPRHFFSRALHFLPEKTEHPSLLQRMASRWSFHNHSWLTRQLSPEEWAKTMLRNAGNPISFSQYRNVKEGVMRLFSLLLFFFFLFGNPTGRNIFLFLFYFAFFFSLLDLVLQITKERREKILTRQVPYFIDLFILTLRTGLNIEQTLWCVTEKESLLTVTVRRKLEELNLGRSLHEIFEDLEAEVRNEEFQNFLRSVRQSQTLGVSLAYTLEIQSQLIRTKRKQRAEEISRTAAVKISLPLVLFIFPALLIIYIGPGILNVL